MFQNNSNHQKKVVLLMISNEEKGCKEPETLTSKLSPKDDNGSQTKKSYQKERSEKLSVLLRAQTTFKI